ncbi:GNAT family N-acetyltransferase [Candidatus Fermentibacteria bacterium]|nr:MAG: GNAT family N-acetyltransferase [Candidatus Fermentibacteria bacterium]
MVVPMALSHYSQLRSLWESFPGNAVTGADSLQGFELFLRRNGSFCFSAVEGSEVIGSVMAGEDSRRGYIYHLAVRSDHQNSGIGGRLMEEAEKALFDAGIEKVHLMIFSDNPAIEFYRKAGWHLRDDIEVMSKVLRGDR